MNICVKYCGGCNPRYDRKKIIDYLKIDFHNISITSQFDNATCDFVVVISGCMSACANHKDIDGKYGKFVVKDLNDYEDLKNVLKNLSID